MKYTDETYDELVKQTYCQIDGEYVNSEASQFLKKLYENNYLLTTGEQKIPKRIHQIWLGSPIPEKYKRLGDTWILKHPGWEYKLWTDEDVAGFGLEKWQIFRGSNNWGQKSDIFRYEILKRYGGIYVDTDFECIKPFDDLLYLNFFTSLAYEMKVELYIGLIATVPNHPIINRCVQKLRLLPKGKGYHHIFESTGSYHFTRCFMEEAKNSPCGVVAFPMGFFYPWPNNQRKHHHPNSFIKPYSYAIHRWAVSWTKVKEQ